MSRPNPTGHPARYSEAIVQLLAEIVVAEYPEWLGRPQVVDCFGGTGEALADFAQRCRDLDEPYHIGFDVSGIELEAPFIVDPIVKQGDATDARCYPMSPVGRTVIVTSPTYPNGCADSFIPRDESKRFTYIASLLRHTGDPDYRLHPSNQAAQGYRGTKRGGASKRRQRYWEIADAAATAWELIGVELVLANLSDFKHGGGEIEPVVTDWRSLLARHGFTDQLEIPVATPRMRNGENSDQRVETEVIIRARRA